MTLELSPDEVDWLLRCVHWGTWVKNATKLPHERDVKLDEFRQSVYRRVHQATGSQALEFDSENQLYLLNEAFETEIHPTIDEYDEEIFWEQLSTLLAQRDWALKNPGKARRAAEGKDTAPQERLAGVLAEKDRWDNEWETWGVQRLGIVK